MADKPRIGILGMGTMGGPMARRLVETGFTVTGYEHDQTRAGKAKADGVTLASSPARVAEASDMMLSSLPDVATVRRAYEAADGAIAGARAGMTFIDVSTTDPESWREVAKAAKAKGVECLDAGERRSHRRGNRQADLPHRRRGRGARAVPPRAGRARPRDPSHRAPRLGADHQDREQRDVGGQRGGGRGGHGPGRAGGARPAATLRYPLDERRPLAPLHQALPQRAGGRLHALLRHQSVPEGRGDRSEHGGQPRAAHACDL